MNHVSLACRLKIRSPCHSNDCLRKSERLRQCAISFQRPSRRLSPLIEVAAMFGCGRVTRKFQAHHESTAVLPGPFDAFMAMRGVVGNERSTSSCQGSGSTSNISRTKISGCCAQVVILSLACEKGPSAAMLRRASSFQATIVWLALLRHSASTVAMHESALVGSGTGAGKHKEANTAAARTRALEIML